jgi:hypothetical protein
VNVVYYVRAGERNEELRFSLRSLQNLDHERVWVIGHKPAWVTGVEHIPGNLARGAQANAIANLSLACQAIAAERFVVFNDDFYVMDPVPGVPTCHAGPLAERTRPMPAELRMAKTMLVEMGHRDPIDWTLHLPLVVWRRKLARILAALTRPAEWRTMYGNLTGTTGERAPDVKIRRRSDPMPAGPFLSTSDATFPALRKMLATRFPSPSRYEAA